MMVSVLGKFAQQNSKSESILVKSQSALNNVFKDSTILDIFPLDKVCHIIIKGKQRNSSMNRSANSIIYSYITANSRIFMHTEMLKIWNMGGKIYAMENDCLYWIRPKLIPSPLKHSHLFGSFKNEFDNCLMLSFISFGTKSTAIAYLKDSKVEYKIKARGFNFKSNMASKIIDFDSFQSLLDASEKQIFTSIAIPQMRSSRNLQNQTITQKIENYQLSNVISSARVILNDFTSFPYGYSK
jgi:hypothetical protein